MKHRTGTDQSTGGFLKEPGTYHLIVTDATEQPINKDGAIIDNAAFRLVCEVLAGTVAGQENKIVELLFFYPKPSDKNEGAFARKKIDRYLMAANLMTDEQKDADLEVDIVRTIGTQFIATLELDDTEKFLRLAFCEIYHIDDPAKKTVPKDEKALKLIASSKRRIGSRPAAATKPSSNGGQPPQKAPAPMTTAHPAPPAPGEAADEWEL